MAWVIWFAYGRAAWTYCWARRICDAAISSMARVIWAVDWTDRDRRRTARSCAPTWPCLGGLRIALQRLGGVLVLPLHRLLGLRRGVDLAGLEPLRELLDGLARAASRSSSRALLHDLLHHLALAGPHELQQLGLEPAHVLDRDLVEVTVAARPDRDDLVLDQERAVLGLLEQLDHPGAPGQLGLGRLVQVRAELGEGLQGRNCARSSRRRPATDFAALTWALPPPG